MAGDKELSAKQYCLPTAYSFFKDHIQKAIKDLIFSSTIK